MDQRSVLTNSLRSFAIADSRRLDNSLVAAHVIHESDKSLIQYFDLVIEECFGFRDGDSWHDETPASLLCLNPTKLGDLLDLIASRDKQLLR
jgi:hypothetical protein